MNIGYLPAVCIACFVIGMSAGSAPAQAPNSPPQPPVSAPPPAGQAGAPTRGTNAVDLTWLRNFLQQQQATIQRLQEAANTSLSNSQQAEQRFEEMIQAYRNLIDAVGSKSENAKKIEAFAAQFEAFAREAAGSSNPARRARVPQFQERAAEARRLGESFVEQSNVAFNQIARLQDLKLEAVDEFRLGQGDKALSAFKEQLEALKAANTQMKDTIDRLSTMPSAGF